MLRVFCALVLCSTLARAWYIPDVSPQSYASDEQIDVKVNALTSNQGVMPFPFYSFKNCAPSKERIKALKKKENIGELLWGDQIEPSEFVIRMNRNVSCRKLCDTLEYGEADMKPIAKLIEQQYRGNLIMDNLPVAQETNAGPRLPKLLIGFPLGVPAKLSPKKEGLINNHLHFKVLYYQPLKANDTNEEKFRIVGFYVSAHSLKYTSPDQCSEATTFEPEALEPLPVSAKEVTWTYSVSFIEEENLPWGTRWDVYLHGT